MRKTAITLVACIWAALSGSAQSADTQLAFGYDHQLPVAKTVEDLNTQLQFSTASQREDLLERIGINPQILHEAEFIANPTAIHADELENTEASMLFLPCSGPGSPFSHLYLLRPEEKQGWQVVDTVNLDCWWKSTTYELVTIPGQRHDAVLVHHVNYGHGSAYVQDNMVLLAVRDAHFVKLLETQEYKSTNTIGEAEAETLEQSSTLQPFPDSSIEETKGTLVIYRDKVKRLVKLERRRFYWNRKTSRYRSGPFRTLHP